MNRKVAAFAAVLLLGSSSVVRAAASPSASAATSEITVAQLRTIPAFKAKLDANQPRPTGDALFDRYAAAIWQLHAPAAYISADDSRPSSLPQSVLASWEQDFGQDPRYWQLCYSCSHLEKTDSDWGDQLDAETKQGTVSQSIADSLGADKAGTFTGADPASYLQHAVDIHSYDLATLDALFLETLKQQTVPRTSDLQSVLTLKPGGAQALLKLADKMVAEFPRESDSWYRRAMLRFELGDDDGGLDDLRHGNAAPVNRFLTVFPYSVVFDGIVKQQYPGSRYVCGMICGDQGPHANQGASLVLKECQRLRADAEQSLDLARWQPVCEFGIRLAEQKGDLALNAELVMQLSSSLCGDLLVKQPEKFTEGQRQHLWDFARRYTDLVRPQALRVELDALADVYDDTTQLARGLGVTRDKLADRQVELLGLQIAAAEELAMLNKAAKSGGDLPKAWIKPDLGWAPFLIDLESTVANNGDKRDAFIYEVNKLRPWDWGLLDFRADPDQRPAAP